jgi:hypothetical protein
VRGLAQNSPFLQSAQGYVQQGAAPISADDIARYYNPWQKNVVDATMANIDESNEQQRQRLIGNTIRQGAWGGDRAGIVQAELARQQGLARGQTLAGLQSQGFTTALDAANRDRAAAFQGAQGEMGLQNASLQGAQAQLQTGDLQQKLAQAGLNLPFSTVQWLASVGTGVGSNMGGTTNGTRTDPAPNPLNSFLGAGLALASFFADGGRVPHKAGGGGLSPAYSLGLGPMEIRQGAGAPQAQAISPRGQQTDPGLDKMLNSALGLAGKIKNRFASSPTDLTAPGSAFAPSGVGDMTSGQWGGSEMFQGLYADGGPVSGFRFGYDDGGGVLPQRRIDDAFDAVQRGVDSGELDPQGINSRQTWNERSPALASAPPDGGLVPMPRPRPDQPDDSDDDSSPPGYSCARCCSADRCCGNVWSDGLLGAVAKA